MKKLILLLSILIVAIITTPSCGALKKQLKKNKKDTLSVVDTKSITTVTTHTENETIETRTITEVTDTTVAVKTETSNVIIDLNNIPPDTTYFDGPIKVHQFFDHEHNILTVHTKYTPPPVTIYKTRTVKEVVKSNSEGESKSQASVKTHTKTESHQSTKTKDVERTPKNNWWAWLLIGILLGVMACLVYKILKKTYFPFLP
jgi:hypothetical protein